ncbi:MAG: amino acid amidase [Clostridiales bacterium GWB2_37_7]|nr:MAG: amino acid amidase [Clostridiales bacterium GWB2_37_7]
MKIYISADIEGIAGIVNWDEATRWKPDYPPFSEEMIKEVQAACEGANSAGAKEIWIKDAHGVGRNLNFSGLPTNTKLIRSFSGHPFCMMQELDSTFDAALMIGYHSYAGSDGNPLSHTLETELSYMKINDELASEFLINAYTASYIGVPVVFVSGDAGLCDHVRQINVNVNTIGLNKGIGDSVVSIHPQLAFDSIKEAVKASLKGELNKCIIPLPKWFKVELSYVNHTKAYKASFYPNMKKISATNVLFETDDYFEVLRMLSFVV